MMKSHILFVLVCIDILVQLLKIILNQGHGYDHSFTTLESVADLHLEIGKSLCIVQIPGSIRLHTQFMMKYHNFVSIITRMIQVLRKIFDYNSA